MDGKHEAARRTINNLMTKKKPLCCRRSPTRGFHCRDPHRDPLHRPSAESHHRDPVERPTAENHSRDTLERPTALQIPFSETYYRDPLERPIAEYHCRNPLRRPTAQRDQIWIFLSWYLQLRGPQKCSGVRRFVSCEVKLVSWLLDVRPGPQLPQLHSGLPGCVFGPPLQS